MIVTLPVTEVRAIEHDGYGTPIVVEVTVGIRGTTIIYFEAAHSSPRVGDMMLVECNPVTPPSQDGNHDPATSTG